MSADDDIPDELLVDAEKLTGLSLELLGLDPHPDHMTAEQRLQLDPEDLAEMAAVAPEERQKSARQTHLLAGLLWNSSGIIAGTSPGCLAAELAVRCLLDQAEITEDIYEVDLPDDWRADVEEVLLEDADSEGLFSDRLEDLEDDARELDFEHWFEPFTPGDAVPPYAYS